MKEQTFFSLKGWFKENLTDEKMFDFFAVVGEFDSAHGERDAENSTLDQLL